MGVRVWAGLLDQMLRREHNHTICRAQEFRHLSQHRNQHRVGRLFGQVGQRGAELPGDRSVQQRTVDRAIRHKDVAQPGVDPRLPRQRILARGGAKRARIDQDLPQTGALGFW